jgi:3-mercaptopyruvate sulfurtransferase SseA
MAKKKQQARRRYAAGRGKSERSSAALPVIPIVVGVVLVVVVLGLLLSLDSWRSTSAESAAKPTALPMSTQQIPYPEVPRMSVTEAQERLARGEIVMVDVRSESSYEALHIEGAISMPEAEIIDRLHELDQGSLLVLYCT